MFVLPEDVGFAEALFAKHSALTEKTDATKQTIRKTLMNIMLCPFKYCVDSFGTSLLLF